MMVSLEKWFNMLDSLYLLHIRTPEKIQKELRTYDKEQNTFQFSLGAGASIQAVS